MLFQSIRETSVSILNFFVILKKINHPFTFIILGFFDSLDKFVQDYEKENPDKPYKQLKKQFSRQVQPVLSENDLNGLILNLPFN